MCIGKLPLLAHQSSSIDQIFSSPAKKFRFAPQSKRITCSKLVKNAKRTKLASLLRSKTARDSESMDTSNSSDHVHRISGSPDKFQSENLKESIYGQESSKNDLDVVAMLPINYSIDSHPAANDCKMPPEETWLPTIMSYWLGKELEEAKQSTDEENSKVAEHLKKTLAYFEDKMKKNNHELDLTEIHNHVHVKIEKDVDEPQAELSSTGFSKLGKNYSRFKGIYDICFMCGRTSTGTPTWQNSYAVSATATQRRFGDECLLSRSAPTSTSRLFQNIGCLTHRALHIKVLSVHQISPTGNSSKKIFPFYVSYQDRLVSLDDQVLADDRPLDYCTKENGELPVNLNIALGGQSSSR